MEIIPINTVCLQSLCDRWRICHFVVLLRLRLEGDFLLFLTLRRSICSVSSGTERLRFASTATSFCSLSAEREPQTFVLPRRDNSCSQAPAVGGICRTAQATADRGSEEHSPFHQVDTNTCWHEPPSIVPGCLSTWQSCRALYPHQNLDGVTSRSKRCLSAPQRAFAVQHGLDPACTLLRG